MTFHASLHTRGGRDFAVELLEASFGAEKAAGVMSRLESSMAGNVLRVPRRRGSGADC